MILTMLEQLLDEHGFGVLQVLGWPKRCELARTLLWEYRQKRLKLAQLLCQLGIVHTWACG